MAFAWFIYTIGLMAAAMVGCATATMVWVLAARRDCLVAAQGFLLYLLDTSIILFDEYIRAKPLGDTYFEEGLVHPFAQVIIGAGIVTSLWVWVLLRMGTTLGGRDVVLLMAGLLGVSTLLAPVGAGASPLRTMAYWGFRDMTVMAAVGWMLLNGVSAPPGAERADLAHLRRPLCVCLVLACAALVEDVVNILVWQPDLSVAWISELIWHLTERNLSENLLVVWLVVLVVRSARNTMQVFARHPAHDAARLADERVRPDFERRLLAFADAHGLSRREREVVALVLQGKDTQNVASELTISTGTVKAHLHRIYRKVGVSSRDDLTVAFWQG